MNAQVSEGERPTIGPHLSQAIAAATPQRLQQIGTFDAVIVGAGAAGSLAALLLVEAGLQVLVLEAGSGRADIEAPNRPAETGAAQRQPVQSRCYAWNRAPGAYVDDVDCPYVIWPGRSFVWIRARQLGGRMMLPGHGRQYYRFGRDDLAPADGSSPPWPFAPDELDCWYHLVERRIGLAGMRDGLDAVPDSVLAQTLELTSDEIELRQAITARWPSTQPIVARFAPPFDALEQAAASGRLLVRPGAIAREIVLTANGRADGVVWVDRDSRKEHRVRAPLVFACASALESTRLLLLSRSGRCPDGLGARSGALGGYLMDHVLVDARAAVPPAQVHDTFAAGRCLYVPRLDLRQGQPAMSGRGFGAQLYRWNDDGSGVNFAATSFGEMLPRADNLVSLDSTRCDAWGVPVLRIDCSFSPAELARAADQAQALRDIVAAMGGTMVSLDDAPRPPGSAIHECGTARMGSERDNAVLDPHNQCWDAPGLYVTDGACFPSQGAQNPTLTILALTARACAHALRRA